MTIFGLIKNGSGPDFHRITNPLLMMDGIDAYITNGLKPEDIEGNGWKPNGQPIPPPDAIYYNRMVSEDLINMARAKGVKIVVDIDDHWLLDPHHIMYQDYLTNDFATKQIGHLMFADAVTCTHERLAEKIYPYNRNVTICPNAIPNNEYFKVERTESEYTRLFWQGSITHAADIELLRGPVKRLNAGKYAMILAGYTEHEAWNRMVNAFTNGLRLKGLVLAGLPPNEYYKNYGHADICVAPLLDTPFNGFKSNLKVLEAAHLSLPVIASYVNPYLDLPVDRVYKQSDWVKWISDLTDTETRRTRGAYLHDYCAKHFNFNAINETRKTVFI